MSAHPFFRNLSRTSPRTLSCALPLAVACAALLGACATQGEPPVADLATARTSVNQAEAAGAPQLAPTEFLAARDKLSRAEQAMHDKRFNDARNLSEEASVDADVAERKARAVKATTAAMDLQQSNAVLGAELDRAATRP
jgi:hypothetical protein